MHAAVDGRGRLLKLILTPGQADDALCSFLGGEKLPEGFCANHVLADAALRQRRDPPSCEADGGAGLHQTEGKPEGRTRCIKERYRHRERDREVLRSPERLRRIATRYD